MLRICKTPPIIGGASRDCCGGPSHVFSIAVERQAQIFGCRFRLSPWLAHDLAMLCFRGQAHD